MGEFEKRNIKNFSTSHYFRVVICLIKSSRVQVIIK